MKIGTKPKLYQARMFYVVAVGIGSSLSLVAAWGDAAHTAPTGTNEGVGPANSPRTIPWHQLGARAGADNKGDGLAIIPTAEGARLRCVFQRLEGEATSEGLWLGSTVTDVPKEHFRVMAAAVGRQGFNGEPQALSGQSDALSLQAPRSGASRSHALPLPCTGLVTIAGQTVRFTRPG